MSKIDCHLIYTFELFAIVEHYIQLEADDSFHIYPPAYAWLRIKQALLKNKIPTFLELASRFLSTGRSKTPLLWYATVIDLIEICDEFHFPNSDLVKSEVASQAVNWEYFPKQFLPLLQKKD